MESIITFIVILLIGSLFGGKKKKKEAEQAERRQVQQEPVQQTQQTQEPSPFKKFKDMSQEMYRELQEEMQQEAEPQRKQPTIQRTEVVVPREPIKASAPIQEVRRSTRKTREKVMSSDRRNRHQARKGKEKQITVNKNVGLLPKTEEDIMKGIIFSEIFSPPKSKR